jgi:hypothetical protein
MKSMMLSAATAALFAWAGCPGRLHGQTPSPDLLASYHFAGAESVSNLPDNTTLREILALPQTQGLARHVLDRLARAPQTLLPETINASQSDRGTPLLRPLLDDLVRRESFLEVRGTAAAPNWLFGITLTPERNAQWQTNLAELATVWKLGTPTTVEQSGVTVTRLESSSGSMVRWAHAGDWLLLGIGGKRFDAWDHALGAIRQTRRPQSALTDAWLTAELDLTRLAGSLGLSSKLPWPHATASASGRDADVRITSRLVFPEAVTGPLEAWHVPTNIIRDPLIGFTAWRGARPLLNRWEVLSRLRLGPAPNQLYFWAQAVTAPQTMLTFAATDPTNRIRAMLEPALECVPPAWRERGLGQIEWREDDHHLVWRSLPLLYPHLRPGEDGGQGFVTGGLFPALQTTNAPPAELLDQFLGKPDLIYYNWEISARRLTQVRLQAQLSGMVAGKVVLHTNSPALPWLDELEHRIGNSATEIVAVSPKEWSLTRRAPIGLTATELVGLVCWIDSLEFPKLTLRLPDRQVPKLGPAPATKR